MNIPSSWLFPSSIEEATLVQRIMADKVVVEDAFGSISHIGGMDVSNNLYDPSHMIYAAAVVVDATTLQVVEQTSIAEKQLFPYVPGLLGFREAPALLNAYKKLRRKPDIIMVDGHGISHPRGLGIASHIGVLLDIPTIGVAKSILVGHPESVLGEETGSQVPLVWKGQTIAMLYRAKRRANPIIVSTGHKVSLQTAIEIVAKSISKYRLPDPTRQAHLAANVCRINYRTN
jgi:deoxyribonuclease V